MDNMSVQPYTVDTESGEVFMGDEGLVPFSSPIMASILSGRTPQFLRVLIEKYPDDMESVEYEYSQFTGHDPISLKAQLQKTGPFEANVLGCAIVPHEPFEGMDGEHHEGYWQTLILTDKVDADTGQSVIFSTSSPGIAKHMSLANAGKGWYLWKKPTRYRFSAGAKNGAHFMENLDRKKPTVRGQEHKA